MYIIINGTRYENAVRSRDARNLWFTAAGLSPGLTAGGTIRSYREDGFLLCEDKTSDYARQESQAGALRLTNAEELRPEPPGDSPTWEELANAVRGGVNAV